MNPTGPCTTPPLTLQGEYPQQSTRQGPVQSLYMSPCNFDGELGVRTPILMSPRGLSPGELLASRRCPPPLGFCFLSTARPWEPGGWAPGAAGRLPTRGVPELGAWCPPAGPPRSRLVCSWRSTAYVSRLSARDGDGQGWAAAASPCAVGEGTRWLAGVWPGRDRARPDSLSSMRCLSGSLYPQLREARSPWHPHRRG